MVNNLTNSELDPVRRCLKIIPHHLKSSIENLDKGTMIKLFKPDEIHSLISTELVDKVELLSNYNSGGLQFCDGILNDILCISKLFNKEKMRGETNEPEIKWLKCLLGDDKLNVKMDSIVKAYKMRAPIDLPYNLVYVGNYNGTDCYLLFLDEIKILQNEGNQASLRNIRELQIKNLRRLIEVYEELDGRDEFHGLYHYYVNKKCQASTTK